MAHECPECYQQCYCGGDIDDILMSGSEEEDNCTHCLDRDDEPDDNGDHYDPDAEMDFQRENPRAG